MGEKSIHLSHRPVERPPPMHQPFPHTLSFDDLELLVLVEDGGAMPREVAVSPGMDLENDQG